MGAIDTAGTYRGELVEGGLGKTKKDYPQFVGWFKATEKYVEELSELQHFHEQGVVEQNEDGTFNPQWVDWSDFDEYIIGFLVLFNDAESFDENSKLLNYEQLQLALGWGGDEFDSLNDDTHVGKKLLFRVEEDEYNGKTQLKVNWVDDYEARPSRELRKLDDDKVKDLSSKLKMGGKKQAAKPAKAKAPAKPGKAASKPGKSESDAKDAAKSSEKESEGASAKPASLSKGKSGPPKKGKGKTKEEPAEEKTEESTESSTSLPKETTQTEAWEFVCEHKGGNSDTDVEEAWIAACDEVFGEDTDEDDATKEQWAKVRDIIIRDLALEVE